MNFTVRLYFYWVSIFLMFYIGVLLVINFFWGLHMNLWQIVLVFIIVGMIPPALMTSLFAKRLNYMESDDITPPEFSSQKTDMLKYTGRNDLPFDEVLQIIDRQWIISYSDRKNRVLKFRTDSRMASWGLGGYIRMDEGENLLMIVYPMYPRSKREIKLVNQVLLLMRTILTQ